MKTVEELKKLSVNKLENYFKTLKYCTCERVANSVIGVSNLVKSVEIKYLGFELNYPNNTFCLKFRHPNDSIYDNERILDINNVHKSNNFYYGLFENANELSAAVDNKIKSEKQEKIAELEKQLAELKSGL